MNQGTKLLAAFATAALLSATSFAGDFSLRNPVLSTFTKGASYLSQLHSFNFEGDTVRKNLTGKVIVDLEKKEIILSVVSKVTHCPRAMMCIQIVGPLSSMVVSAKLPLISKKTNSCGETTYIASGDLREFDGSLETVTVVDRSQSSCGVSLGKDSITEVVYESEENRSGLRQNATFGGAKLELLLKTQPISINQ